MLTLYIISLVVFVGFMLWMVGLFKDFEIIIITGAAITIIVGIIGMIISLMIPIKTITKEIVPDQIIHTQSSIIAISGDIIISSDKHRYYCADTNDIVIVQIINKNVYGIKLVSDSDHELKIKGDI